MPTLQEFAPRFLEGYAPAKRQKPNGIAVKPTILDVHLIPRLKTKRLNCQQRKDVLQHRTRTTAELYRLRTSTRCAAGGDGTSNGVT
jgi:hypothetical protein